VRERGCGCASGRVCALLAMSSAKRMTDFEKERPAHAAARRAGEVIGDTVLELALNQPAPPLKRLPWFNWLFAVGQYQGTL